MACSPIGQIHVFIIDISKNIKLCSRDTNVVLSPVMGTSNTTVKMSNYLVGTPM